MFLRDFANPLFRFILTVFYSIMVYNKQGGNMLDLTTAKNIRKGIADILKNKRYKLRDTQRYAFKALVNHQICWFAF